jgi:hypothetical protein
MLMFDAVLAECGPSTDSRGHFDFTIGTEPCKQCFGATGRLPIESMTPRRQQGTPAVLSWRTNVLKRSLLGRGCRFRGMIRPGARTSDALVSWEHRPVSGICGHWGRVPGHRARPPSNGLCKGMVQTKRPCQSLWHRQLFLPIWKQSASLVLIEWSGQCSAVGLHRLAKGRVKKLDVYRIGLTPSRSFR